MKLALASLLAVLAVLIPLRVKAGQSSQRIPIGSTQTGTQDIQFGGRDGVPSGYMILGDSEVPPAGYSYTGMTVCAEPSVSTWTAVAPMLQARRELAAAVVNGKIYAIGGFGSGTQLASVEEYSKDEDTWSFKASMHVPRSRLSAAVVGQKIYAIGGSNEAYLGTVEEYDPVFDAWSVRSSMPTPRDRLTTVVVNGKILAIGGYNGPALSVVEEYDPATDVWTAKPSLPALNSEGAAVLLNGVVYVTGGDNGWTPNGSTMAYDLSVGTWSVLDGPSIYDHAVVLLGGAVYAFGGNTGGGTTAATIQFAPSMLTWTDQPPMPTVRQTLAAVVLGGRAYVLGGHDDGGAIFATVEVFEPERRLYAHRRN